MGRRCAMGRRVWGAVEEATRRRLLGQRRQQVAREVAAEAAAAAATSRGAAGLLCRTRSWRNGLSPPRHSRSSRSSRSRRKGDQRQRLRVAWGEANTLCCLPGRKAQAWLSPALQSRLRPRHAFQEPTARQSMATPATVAAPTIGPTCPSEATPAVEMETLPQLPTRAWRRRPGRQWRTAGPLAVCLRLPLVAVASALALAAAAAATAAAAAAVAATAAAQGQATAALLLVQRRR